MRPTAIATSAAGMPWVRNALARHRRMAIKASDGALRDSGAFKLALKVVRAPAPPPAPASSRVMGSHSSYRAGSRARGQSDARPPPCAEAWWARGRKASMRSSSSPCWASGSSLCQSHKSAGQSVGNAGILADHLAEPPVAHPGDALQDGPAPDKSSV